MGGVSWPSSMPGAPSRSPAAVQDTTRLAEHPQAVRLRGRDRRGTPDHLRPPPRQHRAGRARQAGGDLARPRRPRGAGARPARGRPGHGEDCARPRDRADDRRRHRQPDPVHARSPADRRHGSLGLRPEDARVRVPAGPDLREHRARRRDQPRDAEDAVGAPRGDGRAPGHRRRRHARAAVAVHRHRHREPDRAGGDVPAPGGAARPLRAARVARLPRRGARDRDRARATARPSARVARAARLGRRRRRLQRRRRGGLHRRADPAVDRRARARDARTSTASSSARRCAAALRSSARRAPGRSSTAATTCCPRMSTRSSCRCSGTACCSRRRSSRRRARSAATRRSRASRTAASSSRRRPRPDWDDAPRPPAERLPVSERQTFPLVPRRRRLVGLPFGDLPSRRRGAGGDVIGARPYVAGDPVSTIDWFATARLSAASGRDEFVVRDRSADEAPRVVLVSDRRPAMGVFPPTCPWLEKPRALVEAAIAIVDERGRGTERHRRRSTSATHDEPYWLPPGRRDRAVARRASGSARRRSTHPRTTSSARSRSSAACAATCRRARSSSSSPTSSSRRPRARGSRRSRTAGTSCPSSSRTRSGSRASRPSRASALPIADPRTGAGLARASHGARGRRAARRARGSDCSGCSTSTSSLGLDPVVIGTSDPLAIDRAFIAWAELRRQRRWAR